MSPSAQAPILLIGGTGQIGWELARASGLEGRVVALPRTALDLSDPDRVRRHVRTLQPGLIVNAAAFTAVDRAEQEPEIAMAVNADAPAVIAEEAKRLGVGFIHYSTDYVFGGEPYHAPDGSIRPYRESDVPNPVNAYGRSKLAGEKVIREVAPAHLILRTSWVYATRGRNFLRTIQRLAGEREELRIVGDQIGSPTWARCVAQATARILALCWSPGDVGRMAEVSGTYHVAAAGQTSWHGFATAIIEHFRASRDARVTAHRVTAITSSEYPTPALRPAYSVLDCGAVRDVFGVALPPWENQLRLASARPCKSKGNLRSAREQSILHRSPYRQISPTRTRRSLCGVPIKAGIVLDRCSCNHSRQLVGIIPGFSVQTAPSIRPNFTPC